MFSVNGWVKSLFLSRNELNYYLSVESILDAQVYISNLNSSPTQNKDELKAMTREPDDLLFYYRLASLFCYWYLRIFHRSECQT